MDEWGSLAALRRKLDVIRAEYVADGRGGEFDAYVERMRASGDWPFDGRPPQPTGPRPSVAGRNRRPWDGHRDLRVSADLVEFVRGLDGALVLSPTAGSDAPEIAWGDSFFYYAPDGDVPLNLQPYATLVTKDYPDDAKSRLDASGRWRVNIHVGRSAFRQLLGSRTGDPPDEAFAEPDVFLPHPLYSRLGWVSVVNPGPRTTGTVLDLIRAAHEAARMRYMRRGAVKDTRRGA
jgi:Family of unknown function (DUF6194)